ncbi:hypothetical protein [Syntrophomonas palmitatica]|uniref:hypothetical protein n=1 Tax=Syntrophomonas palmitatica TaxID=402877 RepID=UPI0012ED02F8|nr:hypothetical protein [Syntrophomonas palmitatica]
MKNKGKFNIILDFLMFLVMLGLFFVKGEYHETLAYTVGGLIVLHIILHWPQIKALYRQLLPSTTQQILGIILIVVLAVGIITMPMYLPNAGERGHGEFGRGYGPLPGYSGHGKFH